MDRPPLTPEQFNSRVIQFTLAYVIVAMTSTFLIGLFMDKVDNKELFTILGPAFSGIVGYFIGRGDRAAPAAPPSRD